MAVKQVLLNGSVPEQGRAELLARAGRNHVRAEAFSPDGRLLASCGEDGTVRRWTLRRV